MQADAVVTPDQNLEQALVECLRADRVRVPPYPAVAAKLQNLVSSQDFGLRQVASIVAADATLAAAALRAVNSASVGGARVDNLESAVFKLGAQELVRMAMAQTVGAAACSSGPLAELRREQWQASLLSAMLCQELATRRGVRPEVGFMAGLLHDFGSVIVLACLEEIALEQKLPALPASTWRDVVQGFHVEFGMIVATRWRLPDAIAEVIASHHFPDVALRMYRPLVQLVVASDQIALALTQPPADGVDPLAAIGELETHERSRVAALLPKLADQLASFEAVGNRTTLSGGVVPSKVARASATGDSWPIDIAVVAKGMTVSYQACALSASSLSLRGRVALPPTRLVSITIAAPTPLTLMVNIRSCEAVGGEHLIIAQPFGLDGAARAGWLALVASTRRAAGLPTGPVATV